MPENPEVTRVHPDELRRRVEELLEQYGNPPFELVSTQELVVVTVRWPALGLSFAEACSFSRAACGFDLLPVSLGTQGLTVRSAELWGLGCFSRHVFDKAVSTKVKTKEPPNPRRRCDRCRRTTYRGCRCDDPALRPIEALAITSVEQQLGRSLTEPERSRLYQRVADGCTALELVTAIRTQPTVDPFRVFASAKSVRAAEPWLARLATIWQTAYGGEFPYGMAGRMLHPVFLTIGEAALVSRFQNWVDRTPAQYARIHGFVGAHGSFVTGRRGSDLLPTSGELDVDVS